MNVPGIYEKDAWYDANLVAYHAVVTYDQQNFMATHYHAKSVKPVWRKRLVKLAEIGNHVFYR
jgi:spore germination cell wall hydrolase CwlJ-like protein